MTADNLLRRFGLDESRLLGEGGESQVYALDADRVLRIYKGNDVDYVRRRQALYDAICERHPPFDVPTILTTGCEGGISYSIEKRMKGRDFGNALPGLNIEERQRALESYLMIAEEIGKIRFPDRPFGEILTPEPLQRDSWPRFLWDRMRVTLEESRNVVEADVPRFGEIMAYLEGELARLEGFSGKSLVHADYFPHNVYLGDDLSICAVGDFSYTTVVGDPRMDIAGAIVYLEVVEGYRPEDTDYLLRLAVERHGPEIVWIIHLYRLYYSVYFSGCYVCDRDTYEWCIRNFVRHLEQKETGSR